MGYKNPNEWSTTLNRGCSLSFSLSNNTGTHAQREREINTYCAFPCFSFCSLFVPFPTSVRLSLPKRGNKILLQQLPFRSLVNDSPVEVTFVLRRWLLIGSLKKKKKNLACGCMLFDDKLLCLFVVVQVRNVAFLASYSTVDLLFPTSVRFSLEKWGNKIFPQRLPFSSLVNDSPVEVAFVLRGWLLIANLNKKKKLLAVIYCSMTSCLLLTIPVSYYLFVLRLYFLHALGFRYVHLLCLMQYVWLPLTLRCLASNFCSLPENGCACVLFVRWAHVKNPALTSPIAAVYYLQTAEGQRVVCALALRDERNRITYRAFDTFLEDYHQILPLGDAIQWNFGFLLVA